jgi:ankyrin repeat protein
MIASAEGYSANVQKLLENGANRALKDHAGKTASDHAAAGGHASIVELLRVSESRQSASSDKP